MKRMIFSVITIGTLAGCMSQQPAPVEFNHDVQEHHTSSKIKPTYHQNYKENDDIIVEQKLDTQKLDSNIQTGFLKEPPKDEDKMENPQPAPGNSLKTIYHEVAAGETLEKIAADYKQSVTEIAELNSFTPPYHVEEYQIIKINATSEILNRRNKEQQLSSTATNTDNANETSNINTASQTQHKFIAPLHGTIIAKFGENIAGKKNKGINILAEKGEAVRSVANGMVVYTSYDQKFGNLVIIKLEHDLFAAYAHLEKLILKQGDLIKQNDLVGHVGDTGSVTKPQLYFAIKQGGIAVDPLKYINIP